MILKPFFTFYGGKRRAAPRYPAPRYDTIREPFAGSAGYSVLHAEKRVILSDIDPIIVGVWDYLIKTPSSEILLLPDLHSGEDVRSLPIPQEAQWLIGFWLNKGASRPRRMPSAWMRSGTHNDSYWGSAIRARIASQVEKIRHWTIRHGSWDTEPDDEATWFVDPPYETAGTHYRFSCIDYRSLGEWCMSRRGQVMVCENVGAKWLPFQEFADIKGNPSKRGGKVSREAIWYNCTSATQ